MSYFLTKERNKKRECVTFIFDPLVKSFLQSTLHGSCFIFISFSPQSISFVSPTTVHLGYIYLIWLYSYYMVIQPHCQFHYSSNPVSGKFLISDRYSLLESEHRSFYYSLSLYIEQKIQQLENTSSLHAAITSKKAF